MKTTDDFRYERKPSCAAAKSTLFVVNKDELEHKGGHWLVHEECIVHTVVCQKAHLGLKRRRNGKKIKLLVLAVVELCLAKGISQLVRRKFC